MKKGMMGLALLAAGLAQGAALDGGTVYAWRGEKAVVWFDATNRAPTAALWRPASACAFVRAGLAMPVKGDGDRLYADRVVWGGAALVQPGEAVRVVADLADKGSGDAERRCRRCEIDRSAAGIFDIPRVADVRKAVRREIDEDFAEGTNRKRFVHNIPPAAQPPIFPGSAGSRPASCICTGTVRGLYHGTCPVSCLCTGIGADLSRDLSRVLLMHRHGAVVSGFLVCLSRILIMHRLGAFVSRLAGAVREKEPLSLT